MYKLRISLCLLVLSLSSFNAISEETWSLRRCIDHALANNLFIQQQRNLESKSGYDLTQSYATLIPTLQAGSSQGFNYGRTIDRFTNEFATERVAFHEMGVSSEMILFAGFQNINSIRLNVARNTALRYDTRKMENDLVISVAMAYLQVLYFSDMVALAQNQVSLSEAQQNRSEIMFRSGGLSRGGLLEIEAQLARERLNLLNASNNLKLARLELMQLLDLDPAEPFEVVYPDTHILESSILTDPATVYGRALRLEPSVLAAESRERAADRYLAITKGERSPRISFFGNLGSGYSEAAKRVVSQQGTGQFTEIGRTLSGEQVVRESMNVITETIPYRNQITDNFSRVLMVRISMPILNRLQTRTRVQHARADLENARLNGEIARNNLSKVITQAHADATAAREKYQASLKAKAAFQESFAFAEQRFNAGALSSLEYNEAKNRLVQSETEMIQAKFEYIFKARVLGFYQGQGFEL